MTSSYVPSRLTVVTLGPTQDVSLKLGMRLDVLIPDLYACLDRFGTMDIPKQDLVKSLVQQHEFQRWLGGRTPGILLINARADGDDETAPMTGLSARLIRDLQSIPAIFTTHFFCSKSIRSQQPITNDAAGMLRLLMSQLIVHIHDPTFLDSQLREILYFGTDIAALLIVFEQVLRHLPTNAYLFCVIDNISEYEDRDRFDDVKLVVGRLRQWTEDNRLYPIMKVLITCHHQSRLVENHVDPKELLSGHETYQHRSRGLNEPAWRNLMKDPLEELEKNARDFKTYGRG